MKKNKAFTLIELLAVIIILAIIALIATPIVINMVEDVRTQGFKQTTLGYYKAAEYIYDEMMMNGKTENIQFTFEDGKQTSSNENYKLEVKGEIPQGGLVYLTKEGHIAVSINNNKYCAYVDDGKTVIVHEDINHCGYTPVPEGCYVLEHGQLYDYTNSNSELDGSEEWMTQEYNMLKYKSLSTNDCPKEFNILLVPSEIDGQKVEGIGRPTYRGTQNISAEHVIIPSGVKVIDYQAFSYKNTQTKMTHVTLPDGLIHIGEYAFRNRSLTNIDIPDSVVAIGNYAFNNNYITSIRLSSNLKYIGASAFEGNQLTKLIISNSVKKIGNSAFSGNEFKEVIIGDVDMTITSGMFLGSKIDKLVIGQGGTGNINIGGHAFHSSTNDNNFKDYSLKTLILGNSVKSIGESAFFGNQLTHVGIPNSVTSIGIEAFKNNQLASVTIPNSITNIPWHAFMNNQLTSIEIPEDVTRIGDYAFANNQLTNIGIPNSVTSIAEGAFHDNQLTSVTIPSSVNEIIVNAFANNQFPNKAAITIEGDATRFDNIWTDIGFPAK